MAAHVSRMLNADLKFRLTTEPVGYGLWFHLRHLLNQFADLYGVSADHMEGECYGLNHLSFFRSIKIDGKAIMPELIERDDAYDEMDMRFFSKELLRHMGCVLNE